MDANELAQDSEFIKNIELAASPEEIVNILQSKGLIVDTQEVGKALFTGDVEMSERELENISGGNWLYRLWELINRIRRSGNGTGSTTGGGGQGGFGGGYVGSR